MRTLLVVLAFSVLAGCTTIQQMMPSQRETAHRAEELQELSCGARNHLRHRADQLRLSKWLC